MLNWSGLDIGKEALTDVWDDLAKHWSDEDSHLFLLRQERGPWVSQESSGKVLPFRKRIMFLRVCGLREVAYGKVASLHRSRS